MSKEFNISRRKALAALGTIGVASAGAGLGTSAYFSDQETFENNQLTAGTLDMKVAATEYYSDWSTDEAQLGGMAADAASTDIRLPAGAEQSDAQDIAIDLIDDYSGDASDVYAAFFDTIATGDTVNGGLDAALDDGLCDDTPEADAEGRPIIGISDVKPGDFGGAQFAFELCDNPGYVWLNGSLVSANENGTTEPERDDPDEEPDTVELLDEIQVAYGVGPINGDTSAFEDTDSGFQPVEQSTLREFLNAASSGQGLELAGDTPAEEGGGTGRNCFAGSPEEGSEVHQVSVVWWLPINHGNQVQSDSVTFDLGFYTEQCRHNDGTGMPTTVTLDGDVASPRTFTTTSTESNRGSGAWQSAGSDKENLYLGPNPEFTTDFDNSLPSFTVDEIEGISYWTKKDAGPSSQDFYLLIYTEPQGNPSDDDWYNKRLNAEPYYASLAGEPVDAPANEWNEWSTGGIGQNDANQLRFIDANRSGIGYGYADGTMPTLQDLQDGPIDWSSLRSSAQSTSIDYGSQTVMSLAISTGSAWNDGFEGYLDDVTVRLTDGTEVVFDLEP